MRHNLYVQLMNWLDSELETTDGDVVEESAWKIVERLSEAFPRAYDDVPTTELIRVIEDWQWKNQ